VVSADVAMTGQRLACTVPDQSRDPRGSGAGDDDCRLGRDLPSEGVFIFIDLVAAAGLAAPAALPPAPARPAAVITAEPVATPARQVFTWRWTDGSKATERTFRKSTSGTIDKIP